MRALALVLLLLPLSGCFGVPEGTVGFQDTVVVSADFYDLETGRQVASGQIMQFVVGAGRSGLGQENERGFIGLADEETWEGRVEAAGFSGVTERNRIFPNVPLEDTVSIGDWVGSFGAPEVGQVIEPAGAFYAYRVEELTAETVTYRAMAEDGQRNALDFMAAELVTHLDPGGDTMTQTVEPMVGDGFPVQRAPPGQQTLLELAPGSYQHLEPSATSLRLAFSPLPVPEVAATDVRVVATVLAHQQGAGGTAAPVDGNYGVRDSPVLNGEFNTVPSFGPHAHAMEGMDGDHMDGDAMEGDAADHGHS